MPRRPSITVDIVDIKNPFQQQEKQIRKFMPEYGTPHGEYLFPATPSDTEQAELIDSLRRKLAQKDQKYDDVHPSWIRKPLRSGDWQRRRGVVMMSRSSRFVQKIFSGVDEMKHEMTIANRLLKDDDLNHLPCLVHVWGVFPKIKSIVYQNNFDNGMTLKSLLSRRTMPPVSSIRALVKNLKAMLKCLHAHRIVHGDIQSDNILVNPLTFQTQLFDLGDAHIIEDTTPLYMLSGTPKYMPSFMKGLDFTSVSPTLKKQFDTYALYSIIKEIYIRYQHEDDDHINTFLTDLERKIDKGLMNTVQRYVSSAHRTIGKTPPRQRSPPLLTPRPVSGGRPTHY